MLDETEISVRRGKLTVAQASVARNAGNPVHPDDAAAAGVRYTSAGDLREAGFAVIHTPGIKGEESGHVSIIWPSTNPLDEQDRAWPAENDELGQASACRAAAVVPRARGRGRLGQVRLPEQRHLPS